MDFHQAVKRRFECVTKLLEMRYSTVDVILGNDAESIEFKAVRAVNDVIDQQLSVLMGIPIEQ